MGLRERFEIRPGQHRPRRVRNGAIFLALLGLVLYSGYSRKVPLLGGGGELVRAEFVDASNVRTGTKVRIRGVDVGKVEGIDPLGEGAARRAVVRMRVDSSDAASLRRDAGASIWWRTLLGRNMYVELEPGRAPERLGGAVIPADRTQTQVELDQALEPLDSRGRHSLRAFLDTLDDALADYGPPRAAIERLAPALRPAGPGLGALGGQHHGDLARAVAKTRTVAAELARSERQLGGLIDGADTTLSVTAARQADLGGMLRLAPSTMDATVTEMVALRQTLDRLDPLADDLRPGARRLDDAARQLTPALRTARPLLRDLRPLLRDLDPAARSLRTAAAEGVPLLRGLDPTLDRLRSEIIPFLDSTDDSRRKVYQLVGPTLSSLDSLTQAFDANGHDVAFQPGAGARFLNGFAPCDAYLTDPSAAEKAKCEGLAAGLLQLAGGGRAARLTPTTSLAGGLAPGRAGTRTATRPADAGSALGTFWERARGALGEARR